MVKDERYSSDESTATAISCDSDEGDPPALVPRTRVLEGEAAGSVDQDQRDRCPRVCLAPQLLLVGEVEGRR